MEKSEVLELDEQRKEAVPLDELKKTATVDTVHNDEALKVLTTYTGEQTWTEKEEKLLVRKIDRRLLSILCVTYGLQYYDKAMLAQAVLPILVPFFSVMSANFYQALFGLRT